MKIFKKMNLNCKDVCPICKTKDEKEVVLIPIVGKQEGFNCEAIQVHLECLNLWYDKTSEVIFQKLK